MLCAQAWKPGSQHAGEKRGVILLVIRLLYKQRLYLERLVVVQGCVWVQVHVGGMYAHVYGAVWACVHVGVYTYVWACVQVYMWVGACVCICVCTPVCGAPVCMCVEACGHVGCIHVCGHVCRYVRV